MPTTTRSRPRKKPNVQRGRTERLETRITAADKALLEQAAELRGMSVSEFAISVLRRISRKTIEQVRAFEYSRRDQEALVSALFEVPAPAQRLVRATRRYQQVFKAK